MLNVYSVFNSIDGEINAFSGIGQPATFIRLKGCNLACEYCDTKYANDSTAGIGQKDPYEFVCEIASQLLPKATITGGEPLLQRDDVATLVYWLVVSFCARISIETNGTLPILPLSNRCSPHAEYFSSKYLRFVVDYKLVESKVPFCEDNFTLLRKEDALKFVVRNWDDYERAVEIVKEFKPKCTIAFSPMMAPKDLMEIFAYSNPDVDKIVNSIDNILATPPGERAVLPNFGPGVAQLLSNPVLHYDLTFAKQLAERIVVDQVEIGKFSDTSRLNFVFSLQLHKLLWPMADSKNEH